jgi:ATP-dependent protease ClpP protease subunit
MTNAYVVIHNPSGIVYGPYTDAKEATDAAVTIREGQLGGTVTVHVLVSPKYAA